MALRGDNDFNIDKAKILIVDDMQVNRIILSSALSAMGVSCDLAESGQKCLEFCRENTYDLILLDHHMPDFDGIETLEELKQIFMHTGKETPVICHTAEAGRSNIGLYKAAGFADVLIKPADQKDLNAILERFLPDGGYEIPQDDEEKKKKEKELASLPSWLKHVTKLDLMSGIEHCKSASDYIDTLTVFAGSINDKASDIERFEKEENWPMYILRVHSLKSVARLIGAVTVADRAADLEYAGNHGEYDVVHTGTAALLDEYRSILPKLRPLIDGSMPVMAEPEEAGDEKKQEQQGMLEQVVMFVGGDEYGIVGRGIVNCLESDGFRVIQIADVPEIILNHRADSNIWLYYPTGLNDHIRLVSHLLAEMCHDDNKTLCLAGDPMDIDVALSIYEKDYIASVYPRPIDLDRMAADMYEYYYHQSEYLRTKTILVIDDDTDFLSIMERWLSEDYDVECERSGAGALKYLKHNRPDLILLDYEMPGMNGAQVMNRIRSNPKSERIPIIFLTGKNEKEDVLRILERKPDGYLLKSMPHTELLEALNRFFVGTIL